MADRLTLPKKLEVVVFILKTKTKSLIYKSSGLHNTLRLLAVAIAILLGFVYGMAYKQLVTHLHSYHDIVLSKVAVGAIFSVLVVMRSYFPSYKPVSVLVTSQYPVDDLFKSTLNFIYDLYEPIYIYYLIFLAVFTLMSTFSLWDGVMIMEFILAAIVADRSIRIQMDHTVRYKPFAVLFPILIFTGMAGLLYWISSGDYFAGTSRLILLTVFLAVITMIHVGLGSAVIEGKNERRKMEADRRIPGMTRLLSRIYLRKASVRQKVLLMFLLKVILVLIVTAELRAGTAGDLIGLYRYIIWSPLMVFSYVHNNYYGFFPNMWTAQRIYGDRFSRILKNYLLSLAAPVSLDFLITVLVSFYPGWVTLPDIGYYLSAFILMTPLGFYVSLLASKKVDNAGIGNFRGSTSQIAAFLFLFGLIILAAGVAFSWYWILLLPVIVAPILIRYARRCFRSRSDTVFMTIAE